MAGKKVTLKDLLWLINEAEFVLVCYNHGRQTYSGTVAMIESNMASLLNSQVQAITVECGALKIFL